MELQQPAGNDHHDKFRLTASTHPGSNEELRDTDHLPQPTHLYMFGVPHSDHEIKSESNMYHLWPIPTPGLNLSVRTMEKVYVMTAKTIPHPVNYPGAQCYKMSQSYARRHEKMELPPNRFHRKIRGINQLLEWVPCSSCTTLIRHGARRLVCWSCKAQYHPSRIMSDHTQIVRTQTTQMAMYPLFTEAGSR